METEWREVIEELERLNGLLGRLDDPRFRQTLDERGRLVERIVKLAVGSTPPDPEAVARLSAALAGGAEIRRQLALERGRTRVKLEEANRSGVLLRRLQDPGRRPSHIDCEG